MDRLQKKCLVGSACMHAFLAFVLVIGSAFFVNKERAQIVPKVRIVPTRLIDAALAGGGGNPKIAPSEDQQKGDTVKPLPPPPEPQKLVQTPPKPQPPKIDPPKPEPVKPEPVKPKPDNVVAARPKPEKSFEPLALKPVTRNNNENLKLQAEADARERKIKADQIAGKLKSIEKNLVTGFTKGTKIEVWGPGGEAYAGYDALVKAIYDDAWEVSDSMTDDDSTTKVKIVIARSGHVLSAQIERRSGNSLLDKSVQRALDSVKFVRPFPEGSHDEQRTFTINFNLKAKRLLG